MFERYTEKARRVIFYARYEAGQYGSPNIETEHLLLALFREDKTFTYRLLRSDKAVDAIRDEIERRATTGQRFPTSVDLPLSDPCKRALAYATEESERLAHRFIGPEHLLLGLLREEKCLPAELLRKHGVELTGARKNIQEYGISGDNLARSVGERGPGTSNTGATAGQALLPLGFPVNTVRVSNLSASVSFYSRLGLRLAKQAPADEIAVLSNGPAVLVLYLESLSTGLLCFVVKDLHLIAAQLEASGVSFEPSANKPDSEDSLLLRDPDGHLVCLLSHRYLLG